MLSLYSVSDLNSTIEYGTYKADDHNPKGTTTGGSVTGIKVGLMANDTFRYNKVIDLSGWTEDDLFLSFSITPDTIGAEDVTAFTIVLTDAYDSANKVTVVVSHTIDGLGYSNSYIRAMATGQKLTGWEWNLDRKHVSNDYGYPVRLSFAGLANNIDALQDVANNSVNLNFDYGEKELHSKIRQASATSTEICDFDSARDFTTLWNGFQTGECFLSISASGYLGAKANFVITQLADQDLSDFSFDDRGELKVTADTGIYAPEALPVAVVGKFYPLFPASCISPYYGELDVTPHVYFAYGTASETECTLRKGSFQPTETGEYTVVYEAKDPFGTVGKAELTVLAVAQTEMITFDIQTDDYPTSVDAGNTVIIKTPDVNGGTGNIEVKTYIEYGVERTQIENELFRPTAAGNYKIVFEATDYCAQSAAFEIPLIVSPGTKPVFETDSLSLPRYFIDGETYVLSLPTARDYTDGSGREVPVSVTYTDSNGTIRVRKDNKITPQVDKNGDVVTVTYTASIDGKDTACLEYHIPAIQIKNANGDLLLNRLLYPTDNKVTSVVAGEEGTTVTFSQEGARVDYINPLIAHGFTLRFSVPKSGASFSRLSVLLRDAEHADQTLKLTYMKGINGSVFFVNDEGSAYPLLQKFASDDLFYLRYDGNKREISFDLTKLVVKPEKTLSGTPFTGFSSGKVWMSLQFEDVRAVSSVLVTEVCRQLLTDEPIDFFLPVIGYLGETGGTKNLGDVVTLPRAIAADCVSPITSFQITVKDPDGNVVKDVNGLALDGADGWGEYTIRIEKIGAYKVSYTAVDGSEN
ncbi:MAG: hypothetical protein ACI4ST_02150, partial [Candidatus Gallimonas sp.]